MSLLQELNEQTFYDISYSDLFEGMGDISLVDLYEADLLAKSAALAIQTTANKVFPVIRRNTIRMHAKNAYERSMMTSVVDVLTKSGKFKIEKSRYHNGAKYWQLKSTQG